MLVIFLNYPIQVTYELLSLQFLNMLNFGSSWCFQAMIQIKMWLAF